MDQTDAFRNLKFELRPRQLPTRLIAVIAALIIFTILWWVVPTDLLYWLLALCFAVMIWLASYGWRQAVSNLIGFLQHLENL